ncbi:MAG: UDP-N-acetylglucosamine 2-epimerase (non-hydrolyzing) [Sediminibacterium sp.]|uniref:non-hydrolyzing UDP-N-acetylglucosamine 2-epimerase n=1 Tax=Sediminibacterium sp. TaxID=1917865 RepID=UPI002ABB49C3|nr:UDP-N-acetylglucosamine 2-epimerase (non-hydrolyzing) [Sediminibacterium sp.]MDZ4070737.1 UDP-N-acetylglucosamine 2-epimerase (non-hydrolyzing) [Sediminibacterium sp.]
MTDKKKIVIVVGARPQFIKNAPLELAMKNIYDLVVIHTGQHYDEQMSKVFFDQLKLQMPNYQLQIGGGTHGKMTGLMLGKIEEVLLIEKPDATLVYGDTNSTLAGALASAKLNIPVIHVEAGLRSYNKTMPEEVNRIMTDHLSSLLFAPTSLSVDNLKKEGIIKGVYEVGDVMVDSLLLAKSVLGPDINENGSILLTLHRPYNTDVKGRIFEILKVLNSIGRKVIFPVHPRTRGILNQEVNIEMKFKNISFIEPVSYFELIKLQMESYCIITDSGGIQKEAYLLKKRCITLRSETEWVETLENGWNTLVFDSLTQLGNLVDRMPGAYIDGVYGVGKTAESICELINESI